MNQVELSANPQEKKEIVSKLFKEFYRDMCKTAYNITRDHASAEDIVQNVFLKLYNQKTALSIEYPKTYLKRITINESIDFYRKNSKNETVDVELERLRVPYEEEDRSKETMEELLQKVNKVIDEMPEKCRLVFILKRKEGMTTQEVADELGISVKTVENQITKAFKILKSRLDPIQFIVLLSILNL